MANYKNSSYTHTSIAHRSSNCGSHKCMQIIYKRKKRNDYKNYHNNIGLSVCRWTAGNSDSWCIFTVLLLSYDFIMKLPSRCYQSWKHLNDAPKALASALFCIMFLAKRFCAIIAESLVALCGVLYSPKPTITQFFMPGVKICFMLKHSHLGIKTNFLWKFCANSFQRLGSLYRIKIIEWEKG